VVGFHLLYLKVLYANKKGASAGHGINMDTKKRNPKGFLFYLSNKIQSYASATTSTSISAATSLWRRTVAL
jgi:hypothetical protein